jgi:thiamine-phosphate pyrophosphorylase
MESAARLQDRLRLMVLTEPQADRKLIEVVEECLIAGATAIQLRDKSATTRELYEQGVVLRPAIRRHDALFIVNDRVDVAVALDADAVQLGPEDLPIAEARKIAPGLLIGFSTDDPELGRAAAAHGASYLGIGALFGTLSKEGLADEAIGIDRLVEVMRASGLPAVGIGGITPENAAEVAATGAGVAALGAVMRAAEPGDAVRGILLAADRAVLSEPTRPESFDPPGARGPDSR